MYIYLCIYEKLLILYFRLSIFIYDHIFLSLKIVLYFFCKLITHILITTFTHTFYAAINLQINNNKMIKEKTLSRRKTAKPVFNAATFLSLVVVHVFNSAAVCRQCTCSRSGSRFFRSKQRLQLQTSAGSAILITVWIKRSLQTGPRTAGAKSPQPAVCLSKLLFHWQAACPVG